MREPITATLEKACALARTIGEMRVTSITVEDGHIVVWVFGDRRQNTAVANRLGLQRNENADRSTLSLGRWEGTFQGYPVVLFADADEKAATA